ncbi:hypothetical protein S4A8_14135 [Salinisphaera sp. S4-8]|uniref:hypothetical protein n=1 Tax=Salinisphaera sp. S4-8 TaxID=633357 RepID=UPI003340232B
MKNYQFPQDWPLPPDYLKEVGRISVLFGSLESSVNVAISKLTGYDEMLDWRSAIVTAHANFKQRIDILETLLHELHDEFPHLAGYRQVVNKIKQVQKKRNRFMHQALSMDPETGTVATSALSARGKLKPEVKQVSIAELRSASADIHVAMIGLHNLLTQAERKPIWEK